MFFLQADHIQKESYCISKQKKVDKYAFQRDCSCQYSTFGFSKRVHEGKPRKKVKLFISWENFEVCSWIVRNFSEQLRTKFEDEEINEKTYILLGWRYFNVAKSVPNNLPKSLGTSFGFGFDFGFFCERNWLHYWSWGIKKNLMFWETFKGK